MIKFARSTPEGWCDPKEAASLAALDTQYHPEWVAARKASGTWFQAVSDQVYADLTTTAPPAQVPATLSASSFQDTCEAGLGGGTTGATRFGKIVRDMQASADDLVLSLYQRFLKAETFDKAKATQFFAVLVNKTIMTGAERTAILNAWPMV